MTDSIGVWEHARYDQPRPEHGYCTDDNARALTVACAQGHEPDATAIVTTSLRFVLDARDGDGRFRNRRLADGRWLDQPRSDDADGRAIRALATARGRAPGARQRRAAADAFDALPPVTSPHLRPHANAALGAAEVVRDDPGNRVARDLLDGARRVLVPAARRPPWFEPRLSYENALLPDALLAIATVRRDDELVRLALQRLAWLVEDQLDGDHFSFVPVGGREPGGASGEFDQQPLEAAAMAEACAHAWQATGDPVWRGHVERAVRWLFGGNDVGAVLHDPRTGATYDGLTREGPNLNRGAESTIAGIATLQSQRLLPDAPVPTGGDARSIAAGSR